MPITPEEKEFIRLPMEDLKRRVEERDDPELAFQRRIFGDGTITNYHPGYGGLMDIYLTLPGN